MDDRSRCTKKSGLSLDWSHEINLGLNCRITDSCVERAVNRNTHGRIQKGQRITTMDDSGGIVKPLRGEALKYRAPTFNLDQSKRNHFAHFRIGQIARS